MDIQYFDNIFMIYFWRDKRLLLICRPYLIKMGVLFVAFGFLAELIKPMQINHDFFYIFVFYIVSPLFFILQGIILTLIYFTDLKFNFVK